MSDAESIELPAGRRRALGVPVVRKTVVSVLIGGATLLASTAAELNFGDGLLLSAFVGGVSLVVQFLSDFDSRLDRAEENQLTHLRAFQLRLDRAEESQRDHLLEVSRLSEDGLTKLGEAHMLIRLMEQSSVGVDSITNLVQNAATVDGDTPQIARDFARYQLDRSSDFLRHIGSGHELVRDGEDHEWILGLTSCAARSIEATSLMGTDAGTHGFEGGFWYSELGTRYLDLQREAAVFRGVRIRRIFVFEKPEFAQDPMFEDVRRMQLEAGIEVRTLTEDRTPGDLRRRVFDFIVFDNEISYEMSVAASFPRTGRPAIVATHLAMESGRVRERADMFERLWVAAGDEEQERRRRADP